MPSGRSRSSTSSNVRPANTDRDETMPLQKFRYAERALVEEWHARMIADFEGMAPRIDGTVFIAKRD